MRIYKLADKLNIPSKEVLKIAKKLKMRKKYAVSTLTVEQEKKIRATALKAKKNKKMEKEIKRKNKILKVAAPVKKMPASPVRLPKKPAPPRKVFVDTGPSLPEGYGKDMFFILPKDPSVIFACWELNKKIEGSMQIRVYEVTGGKDKTCFDISINPDANNWYIKVPWSGAKYRAELGVITNGRFIRLLSSNTILVPRAGISDDVDEEWMIVKEDLQKIIRDTGLGKASRSSLRKAQGYLKSVLGMLRMRAPGSSSHMPKKQK
ncbi:MAG: translation initiation factor IF-2 N-terminal domain-containing protein [bacterium]